MEKSRHPRLATPKGAAKAVPAGSPAARCDACHVAESGEGWMPKAGTAGPAAQVPPRVRLTNPNLR